MIRIRWPWEKPIEEENMERLTILERELDDTEARIAAIEVRVEALEVRRR